MNKLVQQIQSPFTPTCLRLRWRKVDRCQWGEHKLCSMMICAIDFSLSSEAAWRDSSSSCVLKFHKTVQMRALAGAIYRNHPLPPSSQHPNPMDTGLSLTSVLSSPIPPCLRGNSPYGCSVCKTFPVYQGRIAFKTMNNHHKCSTEQWNWACQF